MYDAKRSASGHAVFDAAHEKQLARHLALLGDLRHCIARDELVLHYQPKIDLATRRISRRGGAGALATIPTQGLLLPDAASCPRLERIELIAPVTRWVLNEALQPAAGLARRGLRPDDGRQHLGAAACAEQRTLPDIVAELTTAGARARTG